MGDERTVVLLHGVESSGRTWWRVQQDLEELGTAVVALDLLGHGGRRARDPLTVGRLADDVAERLPDRVDLLVGHSLGAIVALEVARRHPAAVRGLVLEDPPGLAGDLDPADVAREVEESAAAARTDPEGLRDRFRREQPLWSPIDVDHAVESRRLLDAPAVAALLRTDPWDLQRLVADCPVPVGLLVADSASSALQGPDRAALLRALPAERVALIRSGHGIHRDRPALWLHHVLGFAERIPEDR